MADSCIFCRIARGEVPAQMLANNKEIAAVIYQWLDKALPAAP